MLGWVVCAAAVAGAWVCAARGAEPEGGAENRTEGGAAARSVLHLRLMGDLDCMRLATELEGRVMRAREAGVQVVVLEIGGQSWRGDVLLELMKIVRGDGLHTVAWLNDAGAGKVGAGQAALGLSAEKCYLGPKMEIVAEARYDLRGLAPEATVWEQVETDTQGMVWAGLRARGCDGLLAAGLPSARERLWAVLDRPAGAGARVERVTAEEPSAGESHRSVALTSGAAERGGLALKIDGAMAVSLGLVCGTARQIGEIMAAEGISPRPMTRDELRSGLGEARRDLERDLSAVDMVKERADKALDDAERYRGFDAARKKQRAGRQTIGPVMEAIERMGKIERLTAEYPELLRGAPPGQTTVELTPARLSAAWFAAFQDRRDALEALRARAARLAE